MSPIEVLAEMAYGSGMKNQGLVTSFEDCPPIADGEGSVGTARIVTREVRVVTSVDILGVDGETIPCNMTTMDAEEGAMERHEISTEKIDWPELVRHVACERVVVELSEDQQPIAMLVPIERRKTMAELDVALRLLPRLGSDDATSFEADIREVRASMSELDDPWES